MAFHRIVAGPLAGPPAELLAGLGALGEVIEVAGPPALDPTGPMSVGVYLDRRWYLLRLSGADPSALDVDLLHELVLPVFGVHDGALDDRVDYVPDVSGVEDLVARCDADGGAAFVIRPLRFDQLMEVADRGGVMPPKSTYFTPKVRSGVFCCAR